MRLTKLKLAGFKSFVDPTTFHVPGSIIAIVGPNGCGKSNLIDAVRWVMGESAARQLRGESMEDVIFSGSAERRPVGQASIELVFDNSGGRLGGPWARYSEIAIKRQVGRGGQSAYYLNGTRCRRRDITDIFLGTGLGPRSYAIIEQGMISRVIESRPEELRVFLEEAAGISRYKERRRETELRIRHTRENLDRLNDLREELERQLQHLQRQARNAEKYRAFKAEERRLQAGLLALRWRAHQHTLERQQTQVEGLVTEQDRLLAQQRRLETELLQGREQDRTLREALEHAQADYYRIGTEVTRIEQALAHQRALLQQRQSECERIEQARQAATDERDKDYRRLEQLGVECARIEQALDDGRRSLAEAERQLADHESALHDGQQQWEVLTRQVAEPLRRVEVTQVRIDQLERQLAGARLRADRLQQELDSLDPALLEAEQQQLEETAAQLQEALAEARLQLEDGLTAVDGLQAERERGERQRQSLRADHQTRQGRSASLQTLQQAALGKRDGPVEQWLQQQGLADAPRLAEQLSITPGWEAAAESVLQPWLDAVWVAEIAVLDPVLPPDGSIRLYSATGPETAVGGGTLGDHVRNAGALQPLVDAVAIDVEPDARMEEACPSAVTRDGRWRGRGWLCRAGAEDSAGNILVRERELRELRHRLTRDEQELNDLDRDLGELDARLADRLADTRTLQEQVNGLQSDHRIARHRIDTGYQRLEQQRARGDRLADEFRELQQQLEDDTGELLEAQEQLVAARLASERLSVEQSRLEASRENLREAVNHARQQLARQRRQVQQQTLHQQALRHEEQALNRSIARLDARLQQLDARWQELSDPLEPTDSGALEQELESWLAHRLASERTLNAAREARTRHEATQSEQEQARATLDRRLTGLREQLEQARLAAGETRVHRDNLGEQLAALDATPERILAELPETAVETDWQAELERVGQRIQRLGAINLAAIDEHATLAERKGYLDSQDEDLRTALATLEEAMQRIDRETRSRFRDTFDQVNVQLQHLFPRLFGGGQAFLELTGGDTLDAGIAFMARPPGKRIGRIQLLSGGEKALSALALVFAIFQLNPAPFCMLDEVDAPLDEANVGRFGRLVQELAEKVQFIIVTHNKTTMTIARYLIGVTMHEPGVSRLVTVDMDEAVRLAAV